MSKESVALLSLSVVLTGAVAPHRFVTPLGAQAGADAQTLGVSKTAGTVGQLLTVDVIGTSSVETGAAIAVGQVLKVDAAGRAIPWATAGARVAIALQAATGAGQFIEVLLVPNA